MNEQPRDMALTNGEMAFNSADPSRCDRCGEKIRREIVTVRTTSGKTGDSTCFDTAIMCGCRVLRKDMATWTRGGHASEDWIDDE